MLGNVRHNWRCDSCYGRVFHIQNTQQVINCSGFHSSNHMTVASIIPKAQWASESLITSGCRCRKTASCDWSGSNVYCATSLILSCQECMTLWPCNHLQWPPQDNILCSLMLATNHWLKIRPTVLKILSEKLNSHEFLVSLKLMNPGTIPYDIFYSRYSFGAGRNNFSHWHYVLCIKTSLLTWEVIVPNFGSRTCNECLCGFSICVVYHLVTITEKLTKHLTFTQSYYIGSICYTTHSSITKWEK